MKRINSSSVFLIAVVAILGALLISSYHFFSEMNSRYIMIQGGGKPVRQILDNYKYIQNKKALIFSVAFLLAGTSFVFMVALPSEEKKRPKLHPEPAKAPSEEPQKESPISAIVEKAQTQTSSNDDRWPGHSTPKRIWNCITRRSCS